MAGSSIRIIKRPPRAQLRYAAIQKEVAKQVGNVGRLHVQEREKVVADFEHKPEFGYEVKVTPGQVTLEILLKNDGEQVSEGFTIGQLWKSLDKTGVKPHVIRPKRQGGVLAFQSGGPGSYQPHTRPVARSGGPGRVNRGETVFRKQVNHPGFPPRHFSREINKRLKPAFGKAVSKGIRAGWNRVK